MAYYDETGAMAGQALQANAKSQLGQYKPPTPRFKLESQKAELTAHLQRVENALKILDANPGMEEFLEATQGLI